MMGQANPISGASSSQAGDMTDAQRLAAQAQKTASAAVDAVGEQAEKLSETARDYAERGREALKEVVQENKGAGADFVSGVAETLRRVAGEVEKQVPFAGSYIRTAADQVDNVAEGVRSGDPSQLVRQAQDFARQQPTLVAGLAMLAGFGIVRLMKNASAGGDQRGMGSSQSSIDSARS